MQPARRGLNEQHWPEQSLSEHFPVIARVKIFIITTADRLSLTALLGCLLYFAGSPMLAS